MVEIEPELLEFWLKTFEDIQPQIRGVLPIQDVMRSIRQIKERVKVK